MGNVKANAIYNPDESRNPPPANTSEFGDRDSELEKFIRRKYEYGWFKAKPTLTVAESSPTRPRSRTTQEGRLNLSPNHRHTELNDIVVPRRRSSPGPMEAAHRLSANNTGASAGSSGSGPRARPKPASPFMPGIEAPSGASAGNGNSGRRATKALVESSWADLLSLETPSAEVTLPIRGSSRASSTQPSSAVPTSTQLPSRAANPTSTSSTSSALPPASTTASPWPSQMSHTQAPAQPQTRYAQPPSAFASPAAMNMQQMNGYAQQQQQQPMMVNPWMHQQQQPQHFHQQQQSQQLYAMQQQQQPQYSPYASSQSGQPMMMTMQQQHQQTQQSGWYQTQAGVYSNGMSQGHYGQAYQQTGTPNGWGYPS